MAFPVVAHPAVVSVTLIEILVREHVVSTATGFFFKERANKYLITNRHVVINEEKGIYPDTLRIRVHTSPDSTLPNRIIDIPLYENNNRVWLEHPQANEEIDVVAININEILEREDFIHFWNVDNFLPQDNQMMIGERVIILGYPRGYYDEIHNLPITKGGIIASTFRSHFRNSRYFLIDTNLKPGTSGSPVFTAPGVILFDLDGNYIMQMETIHFLGIHSAGRPDLGLNIVWYAEVLSEILR